MGYKVVCLSLLGLIAGALAVAAGPASRPASRPGTAPATQGAGAVVLGSYPLTISYNWLCTSGHAAPQRGPKVADLDAAKKGAAEHERAEHGGQHTTSIESTME